MYVRIFVALLGISIVPSFAYAAEQTPKPIVGTVTELSQNQIIFKTSNAVVYKAEGSYATLVRRNGTPMRLSEFTVGDKVEVRGSVWPDKSISATHIRDLSLYTHTGTFSGKITAVNVVLSTFTLQNSQYGPQTMHVNSFTLYTKNKAAATLQDLQTGMSATVKGVWDRSRQEVVANQVNATVRLLNIDITGDLVMKNGTSLTVVSEGVLYAVDASSAKVRSKNNKTISIADLSVNKVRVRGKHVAEGTKITATLVKDLTVSK